MLHISTLPRRMARRDRFVPLSRTRIPRIVLQDRLCSVHAGAAFSLLRPRLCAVNVKLTMGLGIGASLLVSAHSSACPGLLQGPARLLHRRCQTVWSSRGRGGDVTRFRCAGRSARTREGFLRALPFSSRVRHCVTSLHDAPCPRHYDFLEAPPRLRANPASTPNVHSVAAAA